MKQKISSSLASGAHKVSGIIRDQHQQPIHKALVRAYNKGLRSLHLLGEATTDASGTYSIEYTPKELTSIDLVLKVYNGQKTLLKETEPQFNIQPSFKMDIDLSGRAHAGIPEFDQTMTAVTPYIGDTPLSQLTQTDKDTDISFLMQKTGLTQEIIEKMAMAHRFETFSSIAARIWYGILRIHQPGRAMSGLVTDPGKTDFESRLTAVFDTLMHTPVEALINNLQSAINQHIVAFSVTAELKKLAEQLLGQIQDYARLHPVSGEASPIYQKTQLGGLKGKELHAFLEAHNNHKGADSAFWKGLRKHQELKDSKHLDQLQAVFHLSRLTNHDLPLTEKLIKAEKIKTPADIKKLAKYDRKDWESLTATTTASGAAPRGKGQPKKPKSQAAHLEKAFAAEFPTAVFAARLEKDTKSKLPHRDKISKFLQKNEHFDLLHSRVGQFLKDNKGAATEKEAPELAAHLRRVQRVFKLIPDYDATNLLLKDNIHSAHQVYKMGQDNFVTTYGDKLGKETATEAFQKAATVHANTVALIGNLRSMADASTLKAFPDYSKAFAAQLTHEIPSLETLFGHTDFCDCQECNSVYGAPAYLTDILHFLDQRFSTLPAIGNKTPSVKDILLMRRPDIADIDLECDNTNTEVPYIDIACELMEDFIAPPIVSVANTFLPKLVKGPIDASLLTAINQQFTAAGLTNVSSALTAAAKVSDLYTASHLQPNNTYLTQNHWMIRDSLVTLRASIVQGAATIEFRLLHQTLLPSDAVSAGPEYINNNVYTNFLKTAKSPFTLPFDLFSTEGAMYLEKLGVKKSELINIFRKEDKLAPGASPTDILAAYAFLGINEAEQTLIFVADPTHQSLYWGAAATATAIQTDQFEKLTGLNYAQILNLVQLQFINPTKDTVIEHDDLSSDTTKQRITNLTPAKLDNIHRFLRLWRKTSLTMNELDAILVAPLIANKALTPKVAWQLQEFITLQQKLQLSAFELLAFYQNLDITHSLPDCLYNRLFQNPAVTNPLSANFSITATTPGTLSIGEPDKAVIAAVLQITVADVNALIPKTTNRISFPPLSFMFRYAKLAHALQLSISDLLTLTTLIDVSPFTDLSSTCLFLQKYKLLQASGFSIDDLNYILRHQDNSSHTLVPTASQASAALTQLQTDLLAARTATQANPDPNGELLNKWLSNPVFKWNNGLLNKLIDILGTIDDGDYQKKIDNNSNFLLNLRMVYHDITVSADLTALPLTQTTIPAVPIVFPDSISAQLSFDANNRLLRLSGYMSQADLTALQALSSDAAYQAALTTLYTAAQRTDSSAANIFFASTTDIGTGLRSILSGNTAARFAFFINRISPPYRKLLQQDTLVKDLSTWFTVDKKIVTQLLLSVPATYTEFTDDNFVNKVATLNNPGGPYPTQSSRYQLTAKICFIANRLKLSDTDLAFFLAHATDIASLNLLTLPLAPVTTAVTTFPGVESMINLLRFQQYHPAVITDPVANTILSIYTILTDAISQGVLTGAALTAYTANLITNLVTLTGWGAADLTTLISTPNSLTLTLPADIKSAAILLRLHQRFVTLQLLGTSAVDAVAWCKATLLPADSAKIKQTLKVKYNNSDWLQVTQPLQDTLREKKRDALIAWLLANPGTQSWKTDNDLYSYFLLDVEMCSCQPTSRIVQATNSVQLFVQRGFLGLEDSVMVNAKQDSTWTQWQWMKNFRVWQSNIKVFLYPENWIEPELLPDEIKSPFLKDLENDLLQNEVTAAGVEDAFQNYLSQLDGVARLEVKGMWYDQPSRTLHVFARTFGGNPKLYYYRQFINNKRWTPWTKIDLDITSDHIMPVVFNNHIYLFWAVFTEDSIPPDTVAIPVAGNPSFPVAGPDKNWLIQMAFSEYKNGQWTPKKISDGDDTGQLWAEQENYPDKGSFLFAPFDVPSYDYSKIFDAQGHPIDTSDVFNKKAADAILKNGKLVINCYYYSFVGNGSTQNCKLVGGFELDPVKGYPIPLQVHYDITIPQASVHLERSNRDSVLINMLDTEVYNGPNATTPPGTGIPGAGYRGIILVAEQAGGAFGNLIPMQMDLIDRANFMTNIYNNAAGSSVVGSTFRIQTQLGYVLPYFYQDLRRSYYVQTEWSDNGSYEYLYSDYLDLALVFLQQGAAAYQTVWNAVVAKAGPLPISRYYNFHHPLVEYFAQTLFSNGTDALMDRDTQLKGDIAYDPAPGKFDFKDYFKPVVSGFDSIYNGSIKPVTYPNGVVDAFPGYPKDDVDFSLQSGYGLYNWELFFHAPLMIAERLSQNQQFDDAKRWYNYIFNPMDTSGYPSPDKYWNTKPFFINVNDKYVQQRIENILKGINTGQQDLIQDVTDWRNNPFQPHYIAQYRTVAYQKVAVMKYIGHLIRHGDYLFQQHTMESVNEATQLYILAAEILGPKPEEIPSVATTAVDNYSQLAFKQLDSFSDALVDVENLLPQQTVKGYTGTTPGQGLPNLQTLYFCIPANENMAGPTGYWDTVADRLFKIRHCLDIDGIFAPLSLFAPAIDPGMLVRASAAGLDIGSILNDVNAPLPFYRFTTMWQKAMELCNEVKALGAALQSALEKKDAEAMTLLRSGHEIRMISAVMLIKQQQIKDAQASLDNLNKQKELITIRRDYYNSLLNEGLNPQEIKALKLSTDAKNAEKHIVTAHYLVGVLELVPTLTFGISGFGGSPHMTASWGAQNLASAAQSGIAARSTDISIDEKTASITSTQSGYNRRSEEWQFQVNLAGKELEQIDKQLLGAQIRLDITNQDLANQQLQIDQAKEMDSFMRGKFTNVDLFNWMITQISTTYFQSYQLAYDIARKAERCFRYELGLADSAYINFGYWDSMKKGLLAGDKLTYDLHQLEIAYIGQNKRELELNKPVSLSQLDPVALLKLKTTGECWVNLPEELFDMDYPGHYMRRIKSVSLTIPCISGPYTTVSCTMTMTKNSVRTSGLAGDPASYSRKLTNGVPADDPRFRDAVGALQSIATSSAQNDSGMFEVNFRDDRYLPFEGAGAVSLWHIQLPAAVRQFDYNTISDLIIHLKYTARDGGDALRSSAAASLTTKINQMLVSTKDTGLMRVFSAKNDLATEWYRFLHPTNNTDDQTLTVVLDKSRFPLFVQGKTIKITSIEFAADAGTAPAKPLQVISPAATTDALTFTASGIYGAWLSGTVDYSAATKDPGTWTIKNPVANTRLTDSDINNIVIIVHYQVS